jgi:intein/homing endonuclease
MANTNKLTIFQRLGQIVGPESNRITQKQPTQRYNLGGNTEILKTDNKADFERAKLQAQQNKYLGGMWKKVESGLFQQSMNYETTRIGSYSDFEAMEFYPTIAAALDVMMEESTTVNDTGRVLNIYSDSNRVKGILEDLFFNRLDLHTSLPMWVRNTPIREDSIIPLLDGTETTIKDLSVRVKSGEEIWSFAIQDGTQDIVPSKIIWCDLTRENSELYRVTLDDEKYIDTTPDHEYMVMDGSFKRADSLAAGDLLMSFNAEDVNLTKKVVNNKVVSVMKLPETSNVYCLEAVGPNGEHDRHNFPICGKELNGSYSRNSGVFLSNCKYGDNFVFLNIDDKQGVVGGKQMPNYEMERREVGLFEMVSGSRNGEESTVDKVKFYWRGRDVEFNSWQMAHFRLLGDDRRLPYGTCLKYDSSVETSEGYKEIKDIVIGDMVYSFDETNRMKVLSKVLDTVNSGNKKTYKLSTKHNFIDASKEHKIMYYNTELNKFDYKNTLDFKVGDLLIVDDKINNDFILEAIKSIEESGEHETYDIYVENDNHNFYANGIVVHNSILEKARRIWKQLILSEDAMLVYRITRAPERRVYKIYVGNIDEADVESYVNSIADRFKRMPIVDPQTGQIDLKHHQLSNDQDYFIPVRTEDAPNPIDTLPGACIALDTRIPLLDGRILELNEIISEWDNGNKAMWIHSCDPNTGTLAAGIITWAGETRKNTEVMKITLDNGESITTTPDHKWVHKTKGFVEAQDLVIGDSLMSFNNEDDIRKISVIELSSNKIDTGTITVDGDELYHNYHTFATEAGNYLKNSNLDQIADIEYLQRNLFTSLRVPKPFLGFEETAGDGKNLAIQDIRFSRTINRIQQSMLQELNKIAIIHLYLLGFDEDLDNFTLTLNNPSTQAEMLKVEHLQQKVTLVKDAVADIGNGFAVMSWTRAHREILGWSNDEIKSDLLEQRMEKAASAELANTSSVIKHTGMFDTVDRIYGDFKVALEGGNPSEGEEGGDASGGGGSFGGGGGASFGGGGSGGEDLDFGDEEIEGGEEGLDTDADDLGGAEEDLGSVEEAEPTNLTENLARVDKLLTSKRVELNNKMIQRTKKYQNKWVDVLVESIKTEDGNLKNERVKIYDKSVKINKSVNSMIDDINKMLE